MSFHSFKHDEATVRVSKAATLLRLFSYLLAYKKQLCLVLLAMFFGIAVTLLNPLMMEAAIDNHIACKDYAGLIRLMGFALILNILLAICVKLRMYVMANVCSQTLMTIRQQLYTHIQTLDLQFFDSRPSGKILARIIGDINALKNVLSNSVTTLIPDLVTICAVVVIMFVKNPALAAGSLISLPLLAGGMWYIQRRSHSRWQIHRKKSSNLNAFIHEDLSGIRVIQSFAAQAETQKTFDVLVSEHEQSFIDAVRIIDGLGSIIDFSWGIGTIALYYTGIVLLGIENVSVGTFIAFGTYISMFWHPILNLSNFYNQLLTNISGAERIFEILDIKAGIKDSADALPIPPMKGEVAFSHVSFSYDGREQALCDVSFHVQPGETIALVGPTGAGKTTIVNLLGRFYDLQEGTVCIDGHDIRNVTVESLRQQIGFMTQDNFLFSGTIKDNIRYGKLDATDEEIIQAAKAVNAHDFISRLEHGYDTILQERGGGLSAGQKQLLAFARTMVLMPKILILDEATSSIDTHTELLVQQGIETLLQGRTAFVIAHRLSTIQKADRIFVIDDGKIAEEGSAAELLRRKGLYYSLYMAQFQDVAPGTT